MQRMDPLDLLLQDPVAPVSQLPIEHPSCFPSIFGVLFVLSSPWKNCCRYGFGLLRKESMRGVFDDYSCYAAAELVAEFMPVRLGDERIVFANNLKQGNISTSPAFTQASHLRSSMLHSERCGIPAA